MVIIRRQRETSIEDRVVETALTSLGVKSLKLNLGGHNGWPDRQFLIPGGKPFFIEFKREGEEPAPLQAHRIAFLKELGYDVEVHDQVDPAFQAILKRVQDYWILTHGS